MEVDGKVEFYRQLEVEIFKTPSTIRSERGYVKVGVSHPERCATKEAIMIMD